MQAPDQSRGCTLSSSTCGDTTERHGPLQRLLDGWQHSPYEIVIKTGQNNRLYTRNETALE
jgi:hypothetical protein